MDPVSIGLEAMTATAASAATPAAVGGAGMGMTAAGGILGAVGSLFGGQAKSKSLKYQAGVAQMNALVAKQNAEWAIRSGESEALKSGRTTGQMIGQQKVAQAAGNLDVSRGSPAAVRESQHEIGLIDQDTIRTNAGRRAYGFEVEAANQEAQAKVSMAAAKTAKTASFIDAGSSLLSSGSSVASKWLQASQVGMFGGGEGSTFGDPWEGIRGQNEQA